jgi:multiple sugar transport system ATP-binding protein
MARVVLENVSKSFKGPKRETLHVVRNASLIAEDKEFLVLVGPSGCGKSTTLRMIAGLEDIDEGTISIGGKVVNGVEPKDRDIAMVFQNYALYPHMTVFENMAFGLKLRKYPKNEIQQRVKETAELLGLMPYLDRLPKALSGGQRQRVAVGRAIVRQPQVFLFDEPLSNLDAQMRVQMRGEISRLHQRLGATMIYVTHDQVEAMTMGDRIVVMNNGIVQQAADPLTLYHRPSNLFVAGFIGSPPMNFFHGTLVEQGGALWLAERNEAGPLCVALTDAQRQKLAGLAGREIVLGLRPEHIVASASNNQTPHGSEVRSRVEFVESLGAETFVTLTTGATSFTARFHAGAKPVSGEMLTLLFDMSHAHFFEGKEGKAAF